MGIAWRQILGLRLAETEIPIFHQAVNDWIGGIFSPRVILNIAAHRTKAAKAYRYLVSLITEKIEELESLGPDGSTLSGMLFAEDEESSKRLSRKQIIDNSLLLILAG